MDLGGAGVETSKDGPLDGDCVDLTTPPKFTDAPLEVFGGLKRFNFCGFVLVFVSV